MAEAILLNDFDRLYSRMSPSARSALAFAFRLNDALGAPTVSAPARNPSETAPSVNPEERARIRAKLVAEIWEPELRVDLVDRIVDALLTGYTSPAELRAAVKTANDRKQIYDKTNGAKGKDAIWKTLASWIKGRYEAKGVEWTPTRAALEPKPDRNLFRRKIVFQNGDEEYLDVVTGTDSE